MLVFCLPRTTDRLMIVRFMIASFSQAMRDRLTVFVNTIKADPAVQHVIGFAGGSGSAGSTNDCNREYATTPRARGAKVS